MAYLRDSLRRCRKVPRNEGVLGKYWPLRPKCTRFVRLLVLHCTAYLEDSVLPLLYCNTPDSYFIDGHFSFPDASASKHDEHPRQQHDGPGTHSEPISATEPVPIIQWGNECEQCQYGAASSPDRRFTGTFSVGTWTAPASVTRSCLTLFYGS